MGLLRAVALRTFSLKSDVEDIHIDAVGRNTFTFYQSNMINISTLNQFASCLQIEITPSLPLGSRSFPNYATLNTLDCYDRTICVITVLQCNMG